MITVYETENEFGKGIVKSWASIIDEKTIEQATMISRVPIVDGYLALMPDAHFGFGPPVGSALKTKNAVMPYAVGVDIGCGMIAERTNLTRADFVRPGETLGHIRRLIPSGVGKGREKPLVSVLQFLEMFSIPEDWEHEEEKILSQFGTLGAGNHFVEIAEDQDGKVWFVLHSGSRGIGNMIATDYFKRAQEMCEKKGIKLENKEFAYFPINTVGASKYLMAMKWAQEYAYWQREAMMTQLHVAIWDSGISDWESDLRVNCHHNYAEQLSDGTWLTRKGAIDASKDKLGIIPGSMGTDTYIVRGKGCEEAYNTSPHGAGRVLGRNQAKKSLSEEDFKSQMIGKTWLDRDSKALLDEAPSAYKPIETVIADSADLIEPIAVLKQFINYKGL